MVFSQLLLVDLTELNGRGVNAGYFEEQWRSVYKSKPQERSMHLH